MIIGMLYLGRSLEFTAAFELEDQGLHGVFDQEAIQR